MRQRNASESSPLVPTRLGSLGGSGWPAARGEPKRQVRLRWLRPKNWDEHVADMELMAASPGFRKLRDHIYELAGLCASDRVLDVGAGTGLLVLAAAKHVEHVTAVDASPAMCRHLERTLKLRGVTNADVVVSTATDLPSADATIDVVLSNYCFHHLDDAEKQRALAEIGRVMRPGGKLVFGDMMFRVGIGNPRDRAVLRLLAWRMIRRGPSGLLRGLKNATRILAGRWEHPAGVEWWRDALLQAGFVDVAVHALDHEGGIAFGRWPRG